MCYFFRVNIPHQIVENEKKRKSEKLYSLVRPIECVFGNMVNNRYLAFKSYGTEVLEAKNATFQTFFKHRLKSLT